MYVYITCVQVLAHTSEAGGQPSGVALLLHHKFVISSGLNQVVRIASQVPLPTEAFHRLLSYIC